jgi:long-chain acyl-CoA synthetase
MKARTPDYDPTSPRHARVCDYVFEHAARVPERRAVVCATEQLSYAELAAQTCRLAGGLCRLGITPGTHIGVVLPNGLPFVVALLAASALDLVLVPFDHGISSAALAKGLASTRTDILLGHGDKLDRLLEDPDSNAVLRPQQCIRVGAGLRAGASYEALMAGSDTTVAPLRASSPPDRHAPYILSTTSGSTGAPKPIVLSQRTKILRSLAAQDVYDLLAGEVVLAATPLHHSLAQRLTLLPLLLGGTSILMPRFSPRAWVEAVAKHAVGFTIGVSSQLEGIVRWLNAHPTRLSSLRCLVSSSAPLSVEAKETLRNALACRLHECYGASEIGIATDLALAHAAAKLHSVGTACPDVSIRILDADGRPAPAGAIGEIACRTPLAFSGYFEQPELTERSFSDGHFLTGDLGRLDEDAYLVLAGRKKDLIITGGINVYPKDVEDALNAHPAVREAVVIGIDDAHFGEAVLAVLSLEDGAVRGEADLARHCAEHLATYQRPAAFEIVDALPRNPMGKIDRQALRSRYRQLNPSARFADLLG